MRNLTLTILLALAFAACVPTDRAPAAPGDDEDGGAEPVQIISSSSALTGPYSIQGVRYTSTDVPAPQVHLGIPFMIATNNNAMATSFPWGSGIAAYDLVAHCYAGLFQDPNTGAFENFNIQSRGMVGGLLTSVYRSSNYIMTVVEETHSQVDGALYQAYIQRQRIGKATVLVAYANYLGSATAGNGHPDIEIKFTSGRDRDGMPMAWCHTDSALFNGYVAGIIP